MRPQFWFKTWGTSAFMTVFFTAYIYLLKSPVGAVTVMPLTPLDHWIGFDPWALPIYLSLWLYVSLPVALMHTRAEIVGFGVRIGVVCLIGLACFYLWPNATPPTLIDWSHYPAAALLKGVDAAGNACPSLHVATAVFAGLWLHWMMPVSRRLTSLRWANLVWCAAIAYSTLATKQHVALDVACGAVLGAGCAWLTRPRTLQPLPLAP